MNVVIHDGQIKVFAGQDNDLELSAPISGDTSYNLVLEIDKDGDSLKLLMSDSLEISEMNASNSLVASQSGWTDSDWDGGDSLAVGNISSGGAGAQGNMGGDFLGTIEAPGVEVHANTSLDNLYQSLPNPGVDENDAGAVVGALSTSDEDANSTHSYTVSDDRFEVVDQGGDKILKLKDGQRLDHEATDSIDITVTATDAGGLSHDQQFTINVNDLNDGPVASNVDLGAVQEDGSIRITSQQLLSGVSDQDGDALSISNFSLVDSSKGSLTDNGDGSWTFRPNPDVNANDVQFQYTASDGTETSSSTAILDIAAVADAPNLTVGSTTTTLIDSGFDGGAGFWANMVDGWQSDVKLETWARNGGEATDSDGSVELNTATSDSYRDAPNIYQTVETVDDASYQLTFEYAGRPGYDASVNVIEVVWDGQVIDTVSVDLSNVDQSADYVWQTISVNLPEGTGDPTKLEFREASNNDHRHGRGIHIDNVKLTETVDAGAHGKAGEAIDLPDLSSSLTDTDGSETLTLSIDNLPEGTVLSDGSHSVTVGANNDSGDIADWNLSNLKATPPSDFDGKVELEVRATSTEASNGNSATTTKTIDLKVDLEGETREGTDGNDVMNGTDGKDVLHGGNGNDTLNGGDGNDMLHGGDGDDMFIFQMGDGKDTINGGDGSWTDTINLQDANGGDTLEMGSDWTITINHGSIEQTNDGELILSDDASGQIDFSDGSSVEFDNIDRIAW